MDTLTEVFVLMIAPPLLFTVALWWLESRGRVRPHAGPVDFFLEALEWAIKNALVGGVWVVLVSLLGNMGTLSVMSAGSPDLLSRLILLTGAALGGLAASFLSALFATPLWLWLLCQKQAR